MTKIASEDEPNPRQLKPLVLDIDGFEGPIDVLLALARDQKVDLIHVSILQLADQFLEFVMHARRHQLELAADYLVMAAWLAYLKSRLLLPLPRNDEEPSGAEMAAALQFQLRRLEAMQEAGRKLMERPRLGRDVFPCGAPEAVEVVTRTIFGASLYDLLKAYGEHRRRTSVTTLEIIPNTYYSVDAALKRLITMLGISPDWAILSHFLPDFPPENLLGGLFHRSALCATLIASLELARQGKLEMRQDGGHYSPIYLRGSS